MSSKNEESEPKVIENQSQSYDFNEEDARRFYKWLRHKPEEFTEVRVIQWKLNGKGVSTQFFVSNEEDFIRVCKAWNGKRQVYAGINPRVRQSGKAEDVKRVTGFPFDVDAPTPNKRQQAATEAEVKVAKGWKDALVKAIKQQFKIEPYIDFSGNGYRVCLPCDIEVTDQQAIDEKLKLFFAEYKEKLKLPNFDNISDLPRIIKVPGVWSVKGQPTEERPHRQARLIQIGDTSKIKEITEYILSLQTTIREKQSSTSESNNKDSSVIEAAFDSVKLKKLRNCFFDFINNPKRNRVSSIDSRNDETGMRKALVLEMHFAGFDETEILEVCRKFDDYNFDKSRKEVETVLNSITSKTLPWTCKSIHKHGGCIGENCPTYTRKVAGTKEGAYFPTESIGDMQITPILSGFKSIHPAIGVVDNVAFIGAWLPCEITEIKAEKKSGKQKQKQYLNDLLYLITSNHKAILANDIKLKDHGWRLSYKPLKLKNPWRLESIQEYLERVPCELKTILDDLIEKWRYYIDFPDDREYGFHALWDIGTYFHFLFKAYPYLYVGGIKRAGKTKTLTLHSCVAHNAFFSNNMSTSSIYRLIQNARGTLIIDETEKLHNPERALEFRSILLAGYKKGAVVYRIEKTKKDILVPEAFEIYSPKVMANIRGIEDVMEDRCITTIMKRGKNPKVVNVEIDTENAVWAELRDKLYRFFLTEWKNILEVCQQISVVSELTELVNLLGVTLKNEKLKNLPLLSARELELWKPIFALAKFFDSSTKFTCTLSSLSSPEESEDNGKACSLCSTILELAIDKAAQKNVENMTESGEVILIQVLGNIVAEDNYYKVKDIRDSMLKQFDEEQKWITTRWVGNALRRLGFSEKRRVGTGYEYRLTQAEVKDQCERLNVEYKADDFSRIKTLKYDDKGIEERECAFCGYKKPTGWIATTFKNETLPICDDCRKEWESRR